MLVLKSDLICNDRIVLTLLFDFNVWYPLYCLSSDLWLIITPCYLQASLAESVHIQ